MSRLLELPIELFLEILSYIDSGQEWKSLATVNNGFYNLAIASFWNDVDDDQKCRIFLWACAAGSAKAVHRLLDMGVTCNFRLQVNEDNGLNDQDPKFYLELPVSHKTHDGTGGYALIPGTHPPSNLRRVSFCNPLHVAVSHGQKEIVEILLHHGACIDAVSKDYSCSKREPSWNSVYFSRYTALHVAISTSQEEIAQLLIFSGASIHDNRNLHESSETWSPDHSEIMALHFCAIQGLLSTAKFIIEEQGCASTIDVVDRHGWTPIMYAYYSNHDEVFELLLANGASTQIPTETSISGDVLSSRDIWSTDSSWYLADWDSEAHNLLHQACLDGRWEIAVKLVNHGSDSSKADKQGRQPLILCIKGYYNRDDRWTTPPDTRAMQMSRLIDTIKTRGMDVKADRETLLKATEFALVEAIPSLLTILLDAGLDSTSVLKGMPDESHLPQYPMAQPGSDAFDEEICYLDTGKYNSQQTLLEYACYNAGLSTYPKVSPDLPDIVQLLVTRGCMHSGDIDSYTRALKNLCCNYWIRHIWDDDNDPWLSRKIDQCIRSSAQIVCTQLGLALREHSVAPRLPFELFYICFNKGEYAVLEELAKAVPFAETYFTTEEYQYLLYVLTGMGVSQDYEMLFDHRLRCFEFLFQLGGSDVLLRQGDTFEELCHMLGFEHSEKAIMHYLDLGGRYSMVLKDGRMALYRACRMGCIKLVERLLDLGADPNKLVQPSMFMGLDFNVMWSMPARSNVAVLRLLLERGGYPFPTEEKAFGIGFPFKMCLEKDLGLEFYRELCRHTINGDTDDGDLFDVVDIACTLGKHAYIQEMRSCKGNRVDVIIRKYGALLLQKLLISLSPLGVIFHRCETIQQIDEAISTIALILQVAGGSRLLTSDWRLKKGRDDFTALKVLKKLLARPVNPYPPGTPETDPNYYEHMCDEDYICSSEIRWCLCERIKVSSSSGRNSVTILGGRIQWPSEKEDWDEKRGDLREIHICNCETQYHRWQLHDDDDDN
ncbi:ankyrin [Apiospora arundinis]